MFMQLAQLNLSLDNISNSAHLITARENDEHRNALESAVKDGFLVAYNATLKSFMPLLCQYTTSEGQCTLGLRQATSSLFIEQYTAEPIEHFLLFRFGNNNLPDTPPLLSLHCAL